MASKGSTRKNGTGRTAQGKAGAAASGRQRRRSPAVRGTRVPGVLGRDSIFRNLLENSNVVFFSTDPHGKLTYISPSIEQIIGYRPDEILGRHFSEFIHASDLPHLKRQFAKLAEEILEADEYRVVTKSGADRWVLSSSRPVFGPKRTFAGIAGMLTDVHRGRTAEEAFRETFDLAGVGIAHLSPDWTWLRANETMCEIIGYRQNELAALTFTGITHPDDRPSDETVLERLASGRVQTATCDKRVVRKDGFVITVNSTLWAVRDAAGALKYFIAILEDISGRKRVEDTLQLLRTTVESIPLGITISSLNGRIIYINPAEGRMHGYSVEELLGQETRILAPPHQWSSRTLSELIDHDLVSDVPFTREGVNVRKDGTVFPVVIRSMPVRDLHGRPLALVSVAEDITDRKRMLDALTESERKYRKLVDNSLVGVFRSTVDGRLLFVNEAHARMAGFATPDEMLRTAVPSLYTDPADRERMIAALQHDGQVNNFEFKHRKRDGSSMTVLISAVLDGDMISGMMMDITELKRTEAVLALAKGDWESTFDTITDMITIHDEEFTIIRSNKAAASILGLPWLEMGRAKCYEYYHGTACPPEHCPSCVSLRTGKPSVEERYEPHLGRHLEIRAIPRVDETGRVRGLIHVVRDISDRKRAEEERVRLEARLREAEKLELIGSLAGGVAHEVRNPLNAIMALTDALDREIGANPDYQTFMRHMRTQVDRLSTLMNELLELGKPVDRTRLRRESLAEICALSIDVWKQSKWGRGREVLVAGTEEGLFLQGESKKLQQVFINLLDNAAQHSPPSLPLTIEILRGNGETAQVRVVDRGPGIPEEILPKVFDTFFTTRRGGTGLGLSIVKHIVEMHGGAVFLSNNEQPPGSTATVILPLAERAAAP